MHRIRVLISDDEPAANASVRSLLAKHPEAVLVGECSTGPETLRAVFDLRPDVLFLDVQLPGKSGVEVLGEIPIEALPAVVFVTAYDQYALQAFDNHAVDYLLKPYNDARFHLAFERAKARLELGALADDRRRLVALVDEIRQRDRLPTQFEPPGPPYPERLPIRTAAGVIVIPVAEIGWVEAAGDYLRIHTGEQSYVTRCTMTALESRLDPARFVRVHRSTLVNLAYVRELKGTPATDYVVVLRDGAKRGISGRGREELSRALGVRL